MINEHLTHKYKIKQTFNTQVHDKTFNTQVHDKTNI